MQTAGRPRTAEPPAPPSGDGREALQRALTRVDQHTQRAANLLYGPRSVSELKAWDNTYIWRWRYHPRPSPAPEIARLNAPEGDVWVAIDRDHGFCPDASIDWRPLAAHARLVAWTLCYEPLIAHLRKLFGLALEPVGLIPTANASASLPRCALTFVVETSTGEPVLSGAALFHPSLLGQSSPEPTQLAHESLARDTIPIVFRIVVSTLRISAAELRELSNGDIVSLGSASRVRPGGLVHCESIHNALRIVVRLEGSASRVASIEGGRRKATQNFHASSRSVSMPPNADDQAAREADVDALPVTVSFEAGEIVLTVGELKALAPGALLTLGRKLTDSPITIRANGKALATGELVLIDDFLGVRITGLRNHGSE